jgi:hypothetical protein
LMHCTWYVVTIVSDHHINASMPTDSTSIDGSRHNSLQIGTT